MKKKTKKYLKGLLPKKIRPYQMKSFDEFLASLSPEIIAAADKMMRDILPELNDLPPIILMSKNPNDRNALRKVIPGELI